LAKEKPVAKDPIVKEQAPVPASQVHPVVAQVAATTAPAAAPAPAQPVVSAQKEAEQKHEQSQDSWHKLVSSMDAKDYEASQRVALEE